MCASVPARSTRAASARASGRVVSVAAGLQASLRLMRWAHVANRDRPLRWLMTALRWAWIDAVAVIYTAAGGIALDDYVAHDRVLVVVLGSVWGGLVARESCKLNG